MCIGTVIVEIQARKLLFWKHTVTLPASPEVIMAMCHYKEKLYECMLYIRKNFLESYTAHTNSHKNIFSLPVFFVIA